MIKVCIDPHCEAVFHNTPREATKCKTCDGRILMINLRTYRAKYFQNFFQYDYQTGEYYRPLIFPLMPKNI